MGRVRAAGDGMGDGLVDVSLFPVPMTLSIAALGALRPGDRGGMNALDGLDDLDLGDIGGLGDITNLEATELAHARSLHSDDERARFVVRRVRLRDELAARTGVHPRDVAYWREPCARCGEAHGRPRVTGWAGYLSVSSTQGIGALTFADSPVGVDVERLVSRETALDVTPLLHPRERDAVDHAFAADDLDGGRTFTRIWVRKEALLKATGEGLTAPLNRNDLSDPAARPVPDWHVVDLDMNSGSTSNTETDATDASHDETFGAYAVARRQPQPSSWRRASSSPK